MRKKAERKLKEIEVKPGWNLTYKGKQTAKELISILDKHYEESTPAAIGSGRGCLCNQWAEFSIIFNQELNRAIGEKQDDSEANQFLFYVKSYWIALSSLLDHAAKKRPTATMLKGGNVYFSEVEARKRADWIKKYVFYGRV